MWIDVNHQIVTISAHIPTIGCIEHLPTLHGCFYNRRNCDSFLFFVSISLTSDRIDCTVWLAANVNAKRFEFNKFFSSAMRVASCSSIFHVKFFFYRSMLLIQLFTWINKNRTRGYNSNFKLLGLLSRPINSFQYDSFQCDWVWSSPAFCQFVSCHLPTAMKVIMLFVACFYLRVEKLNSQIVIYFSCP